MACALNGPEIWELREYSGLYGVSVEKINEVEKGGRREKKTERQRARERIFSKITKHRCLFFCLFIFFQIGLFYYYYLFILLYNIVLVLPNIDLNLPWVYMCSPSWTPSHLPPHPTPLGHPSAPAPSTLYHTSNLDWWFISHMIIYMFQCHFPISVHRVQKTVLYICVFFAVSHTGLLLPSF